MKKLKFLKMFLLTTSMIGIFNISNAVAMKRENIQKVELNNKIINNNNSYKTIDSINIDNPLNKSKNLKINILEDKNDVLYLESNGIKKKYMYLSPFSFYGYLPELEDIGETNNDVKINYENIEYPEDPQYEIVKEKDKTIYKFNDSIKFYKMKGEKVYRQKGTNKEFKYLPVADEDIDDKFTIMKQNGKIYYITNETDNNSVLYEVVPVGDKKISYKVNGKEKFYSVKGKLGYYVPRQKRKRDYMPSKEQIEEFLGYYVKIMTKRENDKIPR